MKSTFVCFLKYQYYNKKKKPWRKLKWMEYDKKKQKRRLLKCLCITVILEGVMLLPHDRDRILSVSRKRDAKETSMNKPGENRKAGETREQGLSIDWKEGTVKLWQKVERVEKKKD